MLPLNRFVPAALLVLVAGPAMAQSALPLGEKTPYLLRADAPNRPPATATSGDPSLVPDYDTVVDGINLNGVGVLTTPDPTDARFAFYCTATRIGPRTILTAAHCVTDDDTGALLSTTSQSAVTFLGPGSTLGSPNAVTYTASSVVVRPEWRGFDTESNAPDGHIGYDVAVLSFSSVLPNWITTYGLYTADPLFENTTHVGYGTYGNGEQGGVGFDARRRWGQNVVDYYTSDVASPDWNLLYTDFDDGTRDHDAFCYLIGSFFCDLGRGATEAGIAAGDSGGPLFINGQLAAVASFGTYICSDAACDPDSPPLKDPNVIDGFGALNGFAGVVGNEAFIRANIAAVPEPTTLVLVGGGLVSLVGIARRRRAAAA